MAVHLSAPNPQDIHAVAGVRIGITEAGIRKANRKDLTVFLLDEGTSVAGVFTKNRFCAAPVQVCREHLAAGQGVRAIVINTGRGGTIHTDALMDALRTGRLGAALLDVTDPEPLPPDHPLWSMENVYITPHYSGSHPQYWERADRIFLENLRRYLAGEPMINVVDQAEGY